MPFFILIALLFVLLTLFALYFYFEAKRKKEAQDAKKTLTVRVEKMKKRFKSEAQQWVFSGALSKRDESTMIRLPNYFFVFQPITPENVEHYEQSLESVLLTVNEKVLLVPIIVMTSLRLTSHCVSLFSLYHLLLKATMQVFIVMICLFSFKS